MNKVVLAHCIDWLNQYILVVTKVVTTFKIDRGKYGVSMAGLNPSHNQEQSIMCLGRFSSMMDEHLLKHRTITSEEMFSMLFLITELTDWLNSTFSELPLIAYVCMYGKRNILWNLNCPFLSLCPSSDEKGSGISPNGGNSAWELLVLLICHENAWVSNQPDLVQNWVLLAMVIT